MKYVGRWDNGSGFMEWAAPAVPSVEEAKKQVADVNWTDVDVCQVTDSLKTEGKAVAVKLIGQDWSDNS